MAKILDSFLYDKSLKAYNDLAAPHKQAHFTSLNDVISADESCKAAHKFRLLELGAGCPQDVHFFPSRSILTVVDPNPDLEKPYRDEVANVPGFELRCYVVAWGEDMRAIDDNSQDVVVTTMALCHAVNQKDMLAEILRVLAPGGKYYFWEAVDFTKPDQIKETSLSTSPPKTPPVRPNPILLRQTSTEDGVHNRSEIRENADQRSTLANLKTLVTVTLGAHDRKHAKASERSEEEVSMEERLIRLAGFSKVNCDTFMLDDFSKEELDKMSWMEKKMARAVPKHWHIRGIATK